MGEFIRAGAIGAALLLAGLSIPASAQGMMSAATKDTTKQVRITIENMTTGQGFGPSIFYSHGAGLAPLFKLGDKASWAVSRIGEEGNIGGVAGAIAGKLGSDYGAYSITVNTAPGGTRTAEITVDRDHPLVSGAWMLGMTNDGFSGITGVDAYSLTAPKTLEVMGYDAGSEVNNEKKEYMPALGGWLRDPEDAPITIHKGIRGDADAPAAWNWDVTKPVARVTLTPMPSNAMR